MGAKNRRTVAPRTLTADEEKRILRHLMTKHDLRDWMIAVIGFRFGLRAGEIVGLRVDDVLRAGRVVEHLDLRAEICKRTEPRSIPVHVETEDAIRLYLQRQRELGRPVDPQRCPECPPFTPQRECPVCHGSGEVSPPLVQSRKSGPGGLAGALSVRQIEQIVTGWRQALGLPHWFTSHDMRKRTLTELAKRNLKAAQLVAGHRRAETTARHYFLTTAEEVKGVMSETFGYGGRRARRREDKAVLSSR